MQRLLAGVVIALGCHVLLFMVPILPIKSPPVSRMHLPRSSGIRVGLHRMTPAVPPKKKRFIPSPKPMLPLKERIEKITSSVVRRKSTPAPQQKSTPKPRVIRKTMAPVTSISKRKPLLKKKELPLVPEKKPAVLRRKPPAASPPNDSLPDVSDFFSRSTSSKENRGVKPFSLSDTPIVKRKESGRISPRVSLAYPERNGNPAPQYPILARRRGWQGTVLLTVWVLENGRVGDISIKKSSGYSLLDKAALRAVSRYRFVPGQQDGRPAAMRVQVPVHFRLQGAD
jgi:protein TonB